MNIFDILYDVMLIIFAIVTVIYIVKIKRACEVIKRRTKEVKEDYRKLFNKITKL